MVAAFTGPPVGRPRPPTSIDAPGWSTFRVARILDVSYRQLDYWCRTGFFVPQVEAAGSGSRRRYSDRDLLDGAIIVALLDAGLGHDVLREVMPWVRSLSDDALRGGVLVLGASGSALVSTPADLWVAATTCDGAVVLAIDPVIDRLDALTAAEDVGAHAGRRPRR